MKTFLSLKHTQQLAMTPQLQQAIRFMQLSTSELMDEINQMLESNPLLEIDDDVGEHASLSPHERESLSHLEGFSADDMGEDRFDEHEFYEKNLVQGAVETEIFSQYSLPSYQYLPASGHDSFDYKDTSMDGLQPHLISQVYLNRFSHLDNIIAFMLIDALDEQGFLPYQHLEGIQSDLFDNLALAGSVQACSKNESRPLSEDLKSSDKEQLRLQIEAVRKRLLHFEPLGCGSFGVEDFLIFQLKQYPENLAYRTQAIDLLTHHLTLLTNRDFKSLQKATGLTQRQLSDTLALMKELRQVPNSIFYADTEKNNYIEADILVKKHNDIWQIRLNNSLLPDLKINPHYAEIYHADHKKNKSMNQKLQAAKWFLKSLQTRETTLLKVASFIVQHQRDFFEQGEMAMKPLTLADVASAVELHESTISRITSQKYIDTPFGVVELKFFFSSQLEKSDGMACSSTAIRALIKKLISEENPVQPLSDQKLVHLLHAQEVNIARRTVAKYRESLGISSSSQRKRLL